MKTLQEILRLRAEDNGSRIFIKIPDSSEELSFVDFKREVEGLAQFLLKQNLRAGDPVCILMDNGIEFAVASIASMLAGGVAVPLNPSLTPIELANCIVQSEGVLVLCDQQNSKRVKGDVARVHVYARSDSQFQRVGQLELEPSPFSAPALMLYTSGTTGQQKGAVLSHANLMMNAQAFCGYFGVTENDWSLCVIPMSHSNGFITALLVPLLAGCGVVIPRHFEAAALWPLIHAYQISWMSAVPGVIALLLHYGNPRRPPPQCLRFIRTGSGAVPKVQAEEFEKRFGVNLLVGYGITEASGVVASNPPPPGRRKLGSVGTSIGPAKISIIDEQGQSLPTGEQGEVALSGDTIFLGYRAEGGEIFTGGAVLRTGDLGYIDAEGYLFITGRKKDIINVGGEKVLPGEVEEIILRLPQVEAAAVVGRENTVLGEEVVAFVQLRAGSALRAAEIIGHCKQALATFKLPRDVYFVDALPRGPTGKVLRKELRP